MPAKGGIGWNKGLTKETDERVRKYALQLQRPKKPVPSKEQLNELYLSQRLPPAKIGSLFALSGNTIRRLLIKYGIPIRGVRETNTKRGRENPFYKGKIKRLCLFCGGEFEVYPYMVSRGWGKFCSQSCVACYTRRKHPIRPNTLEQKLIDLITKYNLPYKYVGDGSVVLYNYNPDFINVNGKKQIIEVFGEYWHSPEVIGNRWKGSELGKIMAYNSLGFDCLILWEHQLLNQSEDEIVNLIRQFTKRNKRRRYSFSCLTNRRKVC